MGAWVRGCVGAWVRGCVGAWVRGCVGAWVRGLLYTNNDPSVKSNLNSSLKLSSGDGFSLISTLIAAAIAGLIFTGILSMISVQQKMENSFQQKLAGISLHYQMLQSFKAGSHCACQFDGQTINNSIQTLTLPQLTNVCPSPGVFPQVVAQPNQNIGANLRVKEIKTTDISPTGVTTLGFDSNGNLDPTKDTTEFQGHLVIHYKQKSLIHAIKPIKIPLLLQVDPTGNVTLCGANVDESAIFLRIDRDIASLKNNEIKNLKDDFSNFKDETTKKLDDHESRIASLEKGIPSANCSAGEVKNETTGECIFNCVGKYIGDSVTGKAISVHPNMYKSWGGRDHMARVRQPSALLAHLHSIRTETTLS